MHIVQFHGHILWQTDRQFMKYSVMSRCNLVVSKRILQSYITCKLLTASIYEQFKCCKHVFVQCLFMAGYWYYLNETYGVVLSFDRGLQPPIAEFNCSIRNNSYRLIKIRSQYTDLILDVPKAQIPSTLYCIFPKSRSYTCSIEAGCKWYPLPTLQQKEESPSDPLHLNNTFSNGYRTVPNDHFVQYWMNYQSSYTS